MAITPYLYYRDVDAALRFLSKSFGFRRCGVSLRDKQGRTTHAAMQLGRDLIMMGNPGPRYRNPKRLGQVTQSLYVIINGVDKHCKRARRVGAAIIEEPVDTEYGHRRYTAKDAEGHEWCFAEAIRSKRRSRNTRR